MDITKGLVTLIAPCYNAERYIERFLQSVLIQTFENIQFILVNDGSVDKTEQIIYDYKERLNEKCVEFLYIKQDNNGAASAVCNALKYVKGEYLSWADVDDVLDKDNILEKFNYMKAHSSYGLALCGARAIDEVTGKVLKELVYSKEDRTENILDRLIFGGILCFPGVFMIRTELLFARLQDRKIYWESEVGQNWQLLLPVAYDNKCGYIDEILYDYYVRSDSHSHNVDYNRSITRSYAQERVLKNVLGFIEDNEQQALFKRIEQKYIFQRVNMCISEGRFDEYKKYYNELKTIKNDVELSYKAWIRYSLMTNAVTRKAYHALVRCKEIIK